MKEMRISIEDDLHDLLVQEKKERKVNGRRHFTLYELVRIYLRKGLQTKSFFEEDDIVQLLLQKQEQRQKYGLCFLDLEELAKLYMLAGLAFSDPNLKKEDSQ